MEMKNQPICESNLILNSQVENILREYFKTSNTLDAVDGKVISIDLGFLSDVVRLNLYWMSDKSNDTLPEKVIVKAPKVDHLKAYFESIGSPTNVERYVASSHELECTAFELLQRDKPIKMPEIYGFRLTPALIVMEDMGDKACSVDNIADGVSLAQWKSVVLALADLHAWSLTTDIPWRDRLPGLEALSEFFKLVYVTSVSEIRAIKETYPEYFGHIDQERISKAFSETITNERREALRELTDEVMLHGDTWLNNVMFAKNLDGSTGDDIGAFLDWQMSTRGPGVNDLTRFESCCVNHELRRANWESMLRVYYDRVFEKAGDKCRASFEMMKKAYKMAFSANAFMTVVFLNMTLKTVAKVELDETGRREVEMLERTKAAYDDAAMFLGW